LLIKIISYSEFNLAKVKTTFNLTTSEKPQLFAKLPPSEPSKYLCETLDYNVPLALASNSEKARSEMIIAPILIEVKKEDLLAGIGQCIAEMYAAQLFNQQYNQNISQIMGAVTSGTNWRFMALKENLVEIDLTEYYLDSLPKILGILINSISK
jgi:hypothetical protein